jgi:peptide/nickel transport system substrate-binding protein
MVRQSTRREFLYATATGIGAALAAGAVSAADRLRTVQAASPEPLRGGNWSLPIYTDPVMNPVIAQGKESNWTNAFIFSMLVKPDSRNPARVVPDLAVSWETSKDGLAWTFRLRNDVKWHDGTPFTADDVKFTFDRILDPNTNTRLRSDLKPVKEIQIVNPSTVRFHLEEPYAPLATFLAYTAGIVPKHLLDGKDINTASDFNSKNPVGTGPFKIRSYTSASDVVLEANPNFYFGRSHLDTVDLKIIPDVNAEIAQLNTGGLDFATIEPFALAGVKGNPNFDILTIDQMTWWHISPNTTLPMFADKRVRQALTYALDREAISKNVSGGSWPVMATPIPSFLKPWYDPSVRPYPYDPAKAQSLLAEVGWSKGPDGILQKNGQPFRFKLLWGRIAGRQEIAVLVQQYWRKVGIVAEMDGLEWSATIARFGKRDYDAFLDRWVAPYEPDMTNYFASSAAKTGKNSSVYTNPQMDKLLAAGRRATNVTERRKVYSQFQVLIHEEQPQVFLFWQPDTQVRRKTFVGLPRLATALGDPFYYAYEIQRVKQG